MSTKERIGAPVREAEMVDITEGMLSCGLQDIKCSGNFYTLNNKLEGSHKVFSKLDRMIANQALLDDFPSTEVSFHDEGDFDHTTALMVVYPTSKSGKKTIQIFHYVEEVS